MMLEDLMDFNFDGIEIDDVTDMQVRGEWLKFTDDKGAAVKITPSAVQKLMIFAINNFEHFEEGAWE